MLRRFPFRSLAVAASLALLVVLAIVAPEASADGQEDQTPTIPDKGELKYPNLGSALNNVVVRVEDGEILEGETAGETSVHRAEPVAITIYVSGSLDEIVKFLEDYGGDPRNVGEDYIEAYVPVPLLGQLSQQPGVTRVREIIPPQPDYGPVTSQGVQTHLVQPWHDAGYRGQGINVGIIDSGFEGFSDLIIGNELTAVAVARCYSDIGQYSENPADCELGNKYRAPSVHGTAVAETIIDIAPEASIYIARPISHGDLRDTVDWMISQGVSVINRSVSSLFDGPGDGTSPYSASPLNTVNRAVDGGIIWANAAGNHVRGAWFQRGPYSDMDGDGAIEFDSGDETNYLFVGEGEYITAQLRWEDTWGGASSDFDLYLVHHDSKQIVEASLDSQTGDASHIPHELVRYEAPVEGNYYLAATHESGNIPDWIQLLVFGLPIEHSTGSHSVTNPGESQNPGLLAVGASHYWDTHTIANYSSQGPTPDGRVKPDIVGTACAEVVSYEPSHSSDGTITCWFGGTSQAAPHVAGLAALVRQKFPDYTPQEVAQFLKDNAEERGDPGADNTWGSGFVLMPRPVTEPGAPAIGSVRSNQQSLTVAWAAPGDDGGATITAYDLRHIRSDAPDKADANWTVVASAWTSGSLEYTITGLEGGIQYDVQLRAVNSVGSGSWSGSATGSTETTPGTDECGEILLGDGSVTGQWAAGCDSAVSDRGHARYYSFTLAQESEVTISLESQDANTYLYLRKGENAKSGAALHENDDAETGNSSRSQIRATLAAGTYTVEATTYETGETGSFTLAISGLSGTGTTAPGPGYPPNLLPIAAQRANGPGAIYVGDLEQLVGPAPETGLGGIDAAGRHDGRVPLESLERHIWLYESPYYRELLDRAKFTNPTPLSSSGEKIVIRHACINRALLPCQLLEAFFVPNLAQRTGGQVEFEVTSFPELGVAGVDTLSLIADGTLDSATVDDAYVAREIPAIDIRSLWGVYSSSELEFKGNQGIMGDIEDLVLSETGGVILNHSWLSGNDQYLFCKEPVATVDDFNGKRTRSHSTPLSDWINGMGGQAQFIYSPDVYRALERGILDCAATRPNAAYGERWYEVVSYMIGPQVSFPVLNNVVNGEVWKSIPDDLQQMIIEEAAKSELEALRLASIQNEVGVSKNKLAGLTNLSFSDELQYQSRQAALNRVIPAWIARVGDMENPIFDLFNEKISPIVGIFIEEDGTVTSVTVGDAPLSVSVSHAGMDPVRIGTAIPVAATFTKAVTGFTVADVTVGNGTAGDFSGSGTAYTFNVTPNAIGQVTVDIAADVAVDADGNRNTAAMRLQLGIPYDDNRNGAIERSEVIRAINDYLGDGSLERSHVIALINLYLTGQSAS